MGLLNVIRKLRLRQGLAIREIERRTGLSRNTIKKYLKTDATEPKFTTPERSSKLDPFAEKLTGWRQSEALGRMAEDVFVIINEFTRETVASPIRRAFELAFGMPLLVPAHDEEAAFGAALYGMAAAGLTPTLAAAQALIRYEG